MRTQNHLCHILQPIDAVCDVVVMHMCESTIQPKATLGCSNGVVPQPGQSMIWTFMLAGQQQITLW